MYEHHTERAAADGPGGPHKIPRTYGKHVAPHQPGENRNVPDADGNGQPNCVAGAKWTSADYGKINDNPKKWTGVEDNDDDKLDWAETIFDAIKKEIRLLSYKWEYSGVQFLEEILLPLP